jgi:hypothetical protein
MAHRDDGASRFQRARQLAAELVRDSGPADTFTVILMSEPAETIVGRDVIDHAAVAAEIESLSQRHTGADLRGALNLVEVALSIQTENLRPPERQDVYFFTDLQRSTWQPPASQQPRPAGSEAKRGKEELYSRLAAIGGQAAIVIVDVGRPGTSTRAVTQFSAPEPFATLAREVPLEVTVRQFGTAPRAQCVVELRVDDVAESEQTVDVPAGGEAAVRFAHRFRSPGSHAVTVHAAGDGLSIDDARYLVVPVREEIRVACVAGGEGDADYVAAALRPDPAGGSPIRPVVISEGELAELPFTDFDCLFLCNVAQIAPEEAQRLRQYAEGGGGIVFFLGDRVDPASYEAIAAAAGSGAPRGSDEAGPILPARIGELASNTQLGLDPLDYRHPIVGPFRGRERAGLSTTPVSRYYRLDVPATGAGVQVAAALPNGDPFIVTASPGRGRTVLVATAASTGTTDSSGEPWTNWPTWPSFLPIIRELLLFAASGQQSQWQHAVGAPLGGMLPVEAVGQSAPNGLQIVRPDGRHDPVSVRSAANGWEWSYAATDTSGIYSLRGLPPGQTQQFAVNVDTAESDPAKAEVRELPRQVVVRDTWQRRAGNGVGAQFSSTMWAQPLLWAAFVLLFFEAFLAWQFGRGAV